MHYAISPVNTILKAIIASAKKKSRIFVHQKKNIRYSANQIIGWKNLLTDIWLESALPLLMEIETIYSFIIKFE